LTAASTSPVFFTNNKDRRASLYLCLQPDSFPLGLTVWASEVHQHFADLSFDRDRLSDAATLRASFNVVPHDRVIRKQDPRLMDPAVHKTDTLVAVAGDLLNHLLC